MHQLTLTILEETVLPLNVKPEQLQGEVLLAAAMKLYELGKLSSKAAANASGYSQSFIPFPTSKI